MLKRNRMKLLLTIVVIVISLITALGTMDIPISETNYTKIMDATMYLMFEGSEQSNSICIQNYDAWCNATYVPSDTDSFNKKSNSFNNVVGINYNLLNKNGLPSELYMKSQDNIESVEKNINKLSLHKASNISKYNIMMQTYNNYKKIIDLAINPSGILSEYSNKFIQAYSTSDNLEKQYKDYWSHIAFLIKYNTFINLFIG